MYRFPKKNKLLMECVEYLKKLFSILSFITQGQARLVECTLITLLWDMFRAK